MTTSIGTTPSVANAPSAQAAVLPTAKQTSNAAVSNFSSGVSAPVTTVNGTPVVSSPQTVVDASSGALITQFISSTGTLQSQVPSAVALAYLRAGLTEEGLNRHSEQYQSVNVLTPVEDNGKSA